MSAIGRTMYVSHFFLSNCLLDFFPIALPILLYWQGTAARDITPGICDIEVRCMFKSRLMNDPGVHSISSSPSYLLYVTPVMRLHKGFGPVSHCRYMSEGNKN